MNSWIISLQNEEVFFLQENIVLCDNLSFQCSRRDSEFFPRTPDNGSRLQQYNPILCRNVIRMNWYKVMGNLSLEEAHFQSPPGNVGSGAHCGSRTKIPAILT